MKQSASVAILLAAGLLASCASDQSSKQPADFQSVVSTKKPRSEDLEVPPDLTDPNIQNKYEIPSPAVPLSAQGQQSATAGMAAPSTVVVPVKGVKMERAGTERWLVVSQSSPSILWPLLKAFWQDNGFTIKTEEPAAGVMETDWAENRAKLPNDGIRKLIEYVGLGNVYSTAQRDKFRIRLEKDDNGDVEVYFSHRGLQEVYTNEGKTETKWQPGPPDPEIEAEMLARFMVRLGMTQEQAVAAVKKTVPLTAAQKLPIVEGTLTIHDAFDRAWRRVGLALDRIGLVVTDRNRSQGVYYVMPAKSESSDKASSDFWSGLTFWKQKDKAGTTDTEEPLQVQLKQTAPGEVTIRFTDHKGQALNNTLAQGALERLQNELQ